MGATSPAGRVSRPLGPTIRSDAKSVTSSTGSAPAPDTLIVTVLAPTMVRGSTRGSVWK